MYTEENTQASTGSFGSNSENLNEDSNMSFPENSESNTMPEYSQDSNDADPEMRVGELPCDSYNTLFETILFPLPPSVCLTTRTSLLKLFLSAVQ